jgi:hypothetical protein
MVRRLLSVLVLVVSSIWIGSAAFAFGLPSAMQFGAPPSPDIVNTSFWARPYPYGYTGWGPCVRWVEVQTPRGLAYRRINICRSAH